MSKTSTFMLPLHFNTLPHRYRIPAKRELYGADRPTQRPFGLIELFDTDRRRKFRLPHQGTKECARRAGKAGA